jgi:DNA-binding response OmpR family regulator
MSDQAEELRQKGATDDVRILVAEDERQLRGAIARGLREQSYAVDEVEDCDQTLYRTALATYDAVILDVLMPGGDGMEVCRVLRRRGYQVPILMLTARDALEDKIAGLDAGADDYLTKPFEFGELLARLRALLRRRGEVIPATLVVGDLVVDTARHTARRGSRSIVLTAKEYAFLEYLARHSGRIVSRAELSSHVWDDNHNPFSNLIDVYASRLRRKINEGEAVPLLSTHRGVGHMLAAPPDTQATSPDQRKERPGDETAKRKSSVRRR